MHATQQFICQNVNKIKCSERFMLISLGQKLQSIVGSSFWKITFAPLSLGKKLFCNINSNLKLDCIQPHWLWPLEPHFDKYQHYAVCISNSNTLSKPWLSMHQIMENLERYLLAKWVINKDIYWWGLQSTIMLLGHQSIYLTQSLFFVVNHKHSQKSHNPGIKKINHVNKNWVIQSHLWPP